MLHSRYFVFTNTPLFAQFIIHYPAAFLFFSQFSISEIFNLSYIDRLHRLQIDYHVDSEIHTQDLHVVLI